MKKRGFTLIELLAVIVILAIIALIAVPIVLSIINDSKKSSEKESLNLYTNTVEKVITKKQMSDPNFNPDKCDIKEKGSLECFNGETSLGIIEISMKGDMPNKGTIIIENNKIKYENIELNGVTYYEKKMVSFSVGDKVLYNNATYYVIEDSDISKETVKILKETPLLKSEIDELNLTDINVNESNTYGITIYGESIDYSTSIVKKVVDAWSAASLNSSDNIEVRLITKEELYNLGYDSNPSYPCGSSCGIIQYTKTEDAPTWISLNNQYYFTMSCINEHVFTVNDKIVNAHVKYGGEYAIRPVIELNKSAEITKLES